MVMLDQVCALPVFTSLTQNLNRSNLHFTYDKASLTSYGWTFCFISFYFILSSVKEVPLDNSEHCYWWESTCIFLVQKNFLKNLGCTNFHGDDKFVLIEVYLWPKTNTFITWMWFIHKRKRMFISTCIC